MRPVKQRDTVTRRRGGGKGHQPTVVYIALDLSLRSGLFFRELVAGKGKDNDVLAKAVENTVQLLIETKSQRHQLGDDRVKKVTRVASIVTVKYCFVFTSEDAVLMIRTT